MIKTLILIISYYLLTLSSVCFASGIQVSPARLDFLLPAHESASQTITVVNPTADVQVFEVSADDFQNAIKPMPASFTLESGASKVVTISAEAWEFSNSGGFAGNLSVLAKPLLNSGFSVGTGIKIPFNVTVGAAPPRPLPVRYLLAGGGIAALALAFALLDRKFRKANVKPGAGA